MNWLKNNWKGMLMGLISLASVKLIGIIGFIVVFGIIGLVDMYLLKHKINNWIKT